MTKPAFTPGPWGDGNEAICVKIDRERPWASTVFRRDHDGSEANALVAMTFAGSVDEAVANARLIAAAPSLLEALNSVRDWIRYELEPGAPDASVMLIAIEAALSKALGAPS